MINLASVSDKAIILLRMLIVPDVDLPVSSLYQLINCKSGDFPGQGWIACMVETPQ